MKILIALILILLLTGCDKPKLMATLEVHYWDSYNIHTEYLYDTTDCDRVMDTYMDIDSVSSVTYFGGTMSFTLKKYRFMNQ